MANNYSIPRTAKVKNLKKTKICLHPITLEDLTVRTREVLERRYPRRKESELDSLVAPIFEVIDKKFTKSLEVEDEYFVDKDYGQMNDELYKPISDSLRYVAIDFLQKNKTKLSEKQIFILRSKLFDTKDKERDVVNSKTVMRWFMVLHKPGPENLKWLQFYLFPDHFQQLFMEETTTILKTLNSRKDKISKSILDKFEGNYFAIHLDSKGKEVKNSLQVYIENKKHFGIYRSEKNHSYVEGFPVSYVNQEFNFQLEKTESGNLFSFHFYNPSKEAQNYYIGAYASLDCSALAGINAGIEILIRKDQPDTEEYIHYSIEFLKNNIDLGIHLKGDIHDFTELRSLSLGFQENLLTRMLAKIQNSQVYKLMSKNIDAHFDIFKKLYLEDQHEFKPKVKHEYIEFHTELYQNLLAESKDGITILATSFPSYNFFKFSKKDRYLDNKLDYAFKNFVQGEGNKCVRFFLLSKEQFNDLLDTDIKEIIHAHFKLYGEKDRGEIFLVNSDAFDIDDDYCIGLIQGYGDCLFWAVETGSKQKPNKVIIKGDTKVFSEQMKLFERLRKSNKNVKRVTSDLVKRW